MSPRTEAWVRALVDRFSGLRSLLDEHVEDHFGDLLSHLFLGELTNYAVSLQVASQGGDTLRGLELRELLDHLEGAWNEGESEIQELISVSFLEHLPRRGEDGWKIRKLVGPHLRAQLKVIG